MMAAAAPPDAMLSTDVANRQAVLEEEEYVENVADNVMIGDYHQYFDLKQQDAHPNNWMQPTNNPETIWNPMPQPSPTIDDKVQVELLCILESMKCAKYAYESIMKRACNASLMGYRFSHGAPTRVTYMKCLFKEFGMNNLKPQQMTVLLETNDVNNRPINEVTTFDFVQS